MISNLMNEVVRATRFWYKNSCSLFTSSPLFVLPQLKKLYLTD